MTPKEMEKKIKKDGWYLDSIESSHHHYKHPTKRGKVRSQFRFTRNQKTCLCV